MIWLPGSTVLSSPLLKIPILCSATGLIMLAQTPPTPAPSKDEVSKYGQGRLQPRLLSYSKIALWKTIYVANVLCETTVVCCARFPSHLADSIQAFLVHRPFHTAHDVRVTPLWLTGCLLMSAGALLRLTCYSTLGRFFTWDLSIKHDHTLVTTGPYAVVRHPAYTGSAMIVCGVILCHLGPGSWFCECVGWDAWWGKALALGWASWQTSLATFLISRVGREDQVLKEEFGEAWEAYARRTRYKLIPRIY